MILCVSGSRLKYWKGRGQRAYVRKYLWLALDEIVPNLAIHLVVVGDADGIDQWTIEWCNFNAVIPYHKCDADWDAYGIGAGPIRNRYMLDHYKPGLVLAVWDGQSRGTRGMMEETLKRGIPLNVRQP